LLFVGISIVIGSSLNKNIHIITMGHQNLNAMPCQETFHRQEWVKPVLVCLSGSNRNGPKKICVNKR